MCNNEIRYVNLKKDKLINKSKVKTNIGPLYRPNL